jgi:acyl-CoA-binding protein
MPYKQPPKEHQFKKGNPGKPKGARSFKTIFREAAKEVAEALNLGKDPDAIQIQLVKRGIKEGMTGNYSFYKDLLDRLYGKPKETIDIEGGQQQNINILFLANLLKKADNETRKKYISLVRELNARAGDGDSLSTGSSADDTREDLQALPKGDSK